jgi:hypothetical protein
MAYEKVALGEIVHGQGGHVFGRNHRPRRVLVRTRAPSIIRPAGMGLEIGSDRLDISNVWSFYLLPACAVVLGAWAVIKISEVMKSR